MSEPIYRNVFKVEVFSRGPWELHESTGDDDPFDLKAIDYAITEGDCIGNVEHVESVEVPQGEVRDHLVRIGNDGTFFDDEELA